MSRLLVLIPGNPGDPRFYQDFLGALRARGHEALISAHPQGPADTLLPYAEHHAVAVRRYVAATGRTMEDVQVTLVGHSVGAYLAHLIVTHALLPVERVCMLFPFLARPPLGGRAVLQLVAWPPLIAGVLKTVRALPASWRRRLLRSLGAGEGLSAALAFVEGPAAEASVAMARIERREIAARPDAGYLYQHDFFRTPERWVALACDRDRWAPRGVATTPVAPPVSHGFVAHAAERAQVIEALERFLTR
jgi:pimeloyl-ACP methyl ester carboxylesterase